VPASRSHRPLAGLLLAAFLLSACMDSVPPATPAPAPAATSTPSRPPTATSGSLPSSTPAAGPVATAILATATEDTGAPALYATITAIAAGALQTATAVAAPTSTPAPPTPPPAVPAAALGTYRLIVTARVEGLRVYQTPGMLILSAAAPGSARSAEIRLSVGVRAGHELADLSPGKTVGALYLASMPALLPKGFNQNRPPIEQISYDPATRFLTIASATQIPGGWSTGPTNKTGAPRKITSGKINLDTGTPGQISGQIDLRSAGAAGADLVYSGGLQGERIAGPPKP
jgi:hypothetical protein